MSVITSRIKICETPAAEDVGETPTEFLRRLGSPAWIRIAGKDRSRTRAVATLLHGNEPSGIRALHRYLREGNRPAVDLVCLVGAVQAALQEPGFSHRALPGRCDLNRCFRPPFEGAEGMVARQFLELLREARPECLVDLHNTSGSSPAFAVTVVADLRHRRLAALFTNRLVITDLRMGTLMELGETEFPAVTVECGGALDPGSSEVALQGLQRFAAADSPFAPEEGAEPLEILQNPLRVELREGRQVAFSSQAIPGIDLTLRQDIESFNLRPLPAGELLGWMGSAGMAALAVHGPHGPQRPGDYFVLAGGTLRSAVPLRLSMATTVASIALSDCLFYLFAGIAAER